MERQASEASIASIVKQAIEESTLAEKASMVERHDHILFGNGKPGLLTRFDVMESQMDNTYDRIFKELADIKAQITPLVEWRNTVTIRVAAMIAAASTVSTMVGVGLSWFFFFSEKIHPVVSAAVAASTH